MNDFGSKNNIIDIFLIYRILINCRFYGRLLKIRNLIWIKGFWFYKNFSLFLNLFLEWLWNSMRRWGLGGGGKEEGRERILLISFIKFRDLKCF